MDAVKPGSVAAVGAPPEVQGGESAEVAALVERAKVGDADAFGDLMRLYERRIIAIGIQMGLQREDALDACQDAFVKVFRYIGRFRSGESFFKWLYRIAINAVYDRLRIIRTPAVISIEDLDESSRAGLEDGSPPAGEVLENADLADKLVAGLNCLTRQERIVFVLRDLQEIPTPEIGRVLRLSQVTVRRHCMSARRKLRERLVARKTKT
jgi:RNA polymerase sigma-70 factor, ECF subfamily